MRFALSTLLILLPAYINAYDHLLMLCLVNQQRANYGLQALGPNAALDQAAQEHSQDQANMNTMTHTGSDGSSPGDRVQRAGYNWNAVAENVAYGYGDEQTCMTEWMNSTGHRENILGPYIHFGSAVAYSSSNTPYYTQDFGNDGQNANYPVCPSTYSYSGSSGGGSTGNYNTQTTSKPSTQSYGSTENYANTQQPTQSYGSTENYANTMPSTQSYGNTENYANTQQPKTTTQSYGSTENYSNTQSKPKTTYSTGGNDNDDDDKPTTNNRYTTTKKTTTTRTTRYQEPSRNRRTTRRRTTTHNSRSSGGYRY